MMILLLFVPIIIKRLETIFFAKAFRVMIKFLWKGVFSSKALPTEKIEMNLCAATALALSMEIVDWRQ